MKTTYSPNLRDRLLLLLVMCIMAMAGAAQAGSHLYRLDMRYEGPAPAGPTHLEIIISEGRHCEQFRGSAEADFDGSSITNLVDDDVVTITSAEIVGGSMILHYTVNGYHNGHFHADTCFEVIEGGNSTNLSFHTSCSQPIPLEAPMPGDPVGTYFLEGGEGDCLDDSDPPEGESCPDDHRLYWLAGNFQIPCSNPGNLTLTVYDGNSVVGVSSAYFDGNHLIETSADAVAQFWDAFFVDGGLVVEFEAFGWHEGHFHAHTAIELEVEGCGVFSLPDYHTSCSQPIDLDSPMSINGGAGSITFTDMCGCGQSVVSVESTSWDSLKSLYR